MKIRNTFFLIAPAVFVAFGFYLKQQDAGEDVLLRAITASLQAAHYNPVEINDDFSKKAFGQYLKNIDANKRMLLQSDVDALKVYELQIDDQVKSGSYELFDKSIDILKRTSINGKFL